MAIIMGQFMGGELVMAIDFGMGEFLDSGIEAGCSQEEGPKKGFVMGSRTRGVPETLEKCI